MFLRELPACPLAAKYQLQDEFQGDERADKVLARLFLVVALVSIGLSLPLPGSVSALLAFTSDRH